MKIGPKYKICRRLNDKVFPKCQTTKFSVSGSQKNVRSTRRRRAPSEYGSQLLEKQKARYTYGLGERQFASYVNKNRQADDLYQALEARLDNVVFRLGLAFSRAAARQMVVHGHFLVNGRRSYSPSRAIKVGDKISIRPNSRTSGLFRDKAEALKDYQPPVWLTSPKFGEGVVAAQPTTGETEMNLDLGAIIDFYSRV